MLNTQEKPIWSKIIKIPHHEEVNAKNPWLV